MINQSRGSLNQSQGKIIKCGATASSWELFRDMLLLINNAMVFYLKNMREYKCATLLRDMVCSTWRQTPEETRRGQVSMAAVADPPPIPTMDISTTPAEDTNKLPGKVKATKNGPPSMPRGSRRAPIPTPLLAWRNQEVGKRETTTAIGPKTS
ncbi:hypothetical protein MLD38_010024 [Melastoma candidum]|uniref:Uncharacterized protein n=1 Tax=Melastoma candidum TaxID=119954 RepID=A0ACB9QZS4_9MYRT|nr:hypothetical protein MLD38_010024 [Melastoma candidum]